MATQHHLAWSLALALICAGAKAQTNDPAAARAHLQQGYTLKKQGKCDAAIPHFEESSRLDRQPKALLNLADCEEKLGRLASALSHSVEARDLAQAQRLAPLQKLAEQRRQALEKRVPRLVVRLGKDAPEGTIVMRDGVELRAVSLNTPLPADPGKHVVVARSSTLERTFEVTLAESETKEIEVTPVGGRQLQASSPSPAATPQRSTPEAPPSRSTAGASLRTEATASAPTHSGLGGQRIAALLTGGAGLAAVAVGGYFGARALSTYNAADCDASNVCSEQGLADENRALGQARNATVATVGGLVALTAGVVLWFTAPTSPGTDSAAHRPPPHRLWISADPLGENGARSMTVGGTF